MTVLLLLQPSTAAEYSFLPTDFVGTGGCFEFLPAWDSHTFEEHPILGFLMRFEELYSWDLLKGSRAICEGYPWSDELSSSISSCIVFGRNAGESLSMDT